ncbi:hypothetical protein AB0K92_28660 [Streptomyces sp. NPDC052687]|uniref:hypothetical protein n=1 Tax=Streptomyces sp. NPDC052687 TaxID=3154759 RepID=UPI003423F0A3
MVFGHHVTGREPMIRDGRIFGLDTGVHSVKARADHWSAMKRQWQLPVLKTRPWHDATWPELAHAVERYSSMSDPAARRWLQEVQEWAGGLRATIPTLVATARRLADELSADAMRGHPVAKVLFQARDGRLDRTGLARQCPTPGRTIELAAALGLTLEKLPD